MILARHTSSRYGKVQSGKHPLTPKCPYNPMAGCKTIQRPKRWECLKVIPKNLLKMIELRWVQNKTNERLSDLQIVNFGMQFSFFAKPYKRFEDALIWRNHSCFLGNCLEPGFNCQSAVMALAFGPLLKVRFESFESPKLMSRRVKLRVHIYIETSTWVISTYSKSELLGH